MNIAKTVAAISWLDDSLVSAAAADAPPAKPRIKTGWLVAAACLCLALGSTALAGALKLVHIKDLDDGAHYGVEARMEQLPLADFTGPMMRELPEVFVRQYAADALYTPDPHDPFSGTIKLPPSMVSLDFASAAEAADYIGLEALTVPDWDFRQKHARLTVQGEANGDICALSLEAGYQTDGVELTTWAHIYTEHFDLASVDITWGVSYGGSGNGAGSFTQSAYTTANGVACDIITLDVPGEGRQYTDCYLVHNGIFYQLKLSYEEEDDAYAGALLRQWADMFP